MAAAPMSIEEEIAELTDKISALEKKITENAHNQDLTAAVNSMRKQLKDPHLGADCAPGNASRANACSAARPGPLAHHDEACAPGSASRANTFATARLRTLAHAA
eukprot:m.167936 g.167936  ORF g.167936 m.167936 type:complete len:105 (-) comp9904_c1_seq44:2668-2982(-)